MDQKDLEYFKEKLLLAKGDVLDRVRRTEDHGREANANGETMDLADQATSSYTKEFLFSLSDADRRLLQMIDEALERIEDGSYGYCVETGEPIGRKRLEAVPWARLCIAAQEKKELGR